MNDWNDLVVEELKALNRKVERLQDSLDREVRGLEHELHKEMQPVKEHMTTIRTIGNICKKTIIGVVLPIIVSVILLFVS